MSWPATVYPPVSFCYTEDLGEDQDRESTSKVKVVWRSLYHLLPSFTKGKKNPNILHASAVKRQIDYDIKYREFIFNLFIFLCLNWCFACIYVCLRMLGPGTGVTNSCEMSCGCWELNPDPLVKQPVFLASHRVARKDLGHQLGTQLLLGFGTM